MRLRESRSIAATVRYVRLRALSGDGTYAVSGQKIFISWGDNDFCSNICHLVLARLPDGAPGTKGISLFLVPKKCLDSSGDPGRDNGVNCGAIEHKMGIRGSSTCVMNFDAAQVFLVVELNQGVSQMFRLMNLARLSI